MALFTNARVTNAHVINAKGHPTLLRLKNNIYSIFEVLTFSQLVPDILFGYHTGPR